MRDGQLGMRGELRDHDEVDSIWRMASSIPVGTGRWFVLINDSGSSRSDE